ncbi:MAG TPA: DUF5678 domain-containing protein [Chloroflexota bacterium]|nr:DUF5678 domain-containing protein [Chloroflexota bacterium]
MQNMVKLPQDLYDAIRKKADAQQKTTDALVIEWVSEHIDQSDTSEITQAFEREITAFEQLKPGLLEQYAGKYVAIYQGKVVAVGDDKLTLLDEVRERFGHVVCYIEKVAIDSPRTARIPSLRIAHK